MTPKRQTGMVREQQAEAAGLRRPACRDGRSAGRGFGRQVAANHKELGYGG